MSRSPIEIAQSAAQNAMPFADLLARRCSGIAACIRRGEDDVALQDLNSTTDDLEHFLSYLVLVGDLLREDQPEIFDALRSYREKMLDALEAIQPALGDSDLVEVADALDQDIVASLREYGSYDDTVRGALGHALAA